MGKYCSEFIAWPTQYNDFVIGNQRAIKSMAMFLRSSFMKLQQKQTVKMITRSAYPVLIKRRQHRPKFVPIFPWCSRPMVVLVFLNNQIENIKRFTKILLVIYPYIMMSSCLLKTAGMAQHVFFKQVEKLNARIIRPTAKGIKVNN